MSNDIQTLSNIENLDLLAKQVVEGFIIGMHKSPYHGFSIEFAEHKQYYPGQAIKNIDWKVFARTDKLFVKNFEEETNLRCQIVLDVSPSMYYPDNSNNKMNFSVVAAASLAKLMKRQRDAVGLSLFHDKVKFHISAKSSTVHHKLITQKLSEVLNDSDTNKVGSNVIDSLHEIADRIPKRSLVVLFSDMFDNVLDANDDEGKGLNELMLSLQHLKHNKHEVIVFHVTDSKKELEFEFENKPYHFIDIESGEEVKLFADEAKAFYTKQVGEYKKQLMLKCGQYKIDFVEADINKGVEDILLHFLAKRSKVG